MHREVRSHAGRSAGAGVVRIVNVATCCIVPESVTTAVPDKEFDLVDAVQHRAAHAVLRIRRRPRRGLTQIVDAETRAVQLDVDQVVVRQIAEVEGRAVRRARPVEIERVGEELAQLAALCRIRLVGRPRDVLPCSPARVWQDGPATGNVGD